MLDPTVLAQLVLTAVATGAGLVSATNDAKQLAASDVRATALEMQAQLAQLREALTEFLILPAELVQLKEAHFHLTALSGQYDGIYRPILQAVDDMDFGLARQRWGQSNLGDPFGSYRSAAERLGVLSDQPSADTILVERFRRVEADWDYLNQSLQRVPDGTEVRERFLRLNTELRGLLQRLDLNLRSRLDELHQAALLLSSSLKP